MLTCPNCKKRTPTLARECPRCRADLALLVDYLADVETGLQQAEARTRAGQLGAAVRAYLEVLEVDPDNPTARTQVSEVVTAVRQFDATAPGRQWLFRLHRQARLRRWKEDLQDLTPTGCFTILGVVVALASMLVLGWWLGFATATHEPEPAPVTAPSTAKTPPTVPLKPLGRDPFKLDPKGGQPLGK